MSGIKALGAAFLGGPLVANALPFLHRGGGDTAPINNAANTYANLTRSQFADYMRDIAPYEDKLIEYATNPQVVTDAMSAAKSDVNSAFDRQAGAQERQLGGMGLTLDADEQKVANRTLGLSKSLASIGAQNRARDQTMARQQSLLGNPAPQIGAV